MGKLKDYGKHVPVEASRTKWDKIPRRDLHIHVAKGIWFWLRAEVRRATLMSASGTKIGCGGMQKKAQLFLKLPCRLYNAEHHLPAAC